MIFGLGELTFGTSELTFGAAEPGFGVSELTFGLDNLIFGTHELTFGLAELTFGTYELTFGTTEPTFGRWEQTFGAENPVYITSYNLKEQQLRTFRGFPPFYSPLFQRGVPRRGGVFLPILRKSLPMVRHLGWRSPPPKPRDSLFQFRPPLFYHSAFSILHYKFYITPSLLRRRNWLFGSLLANRYPEF